MNFSSELSTNNQLHERVLENTGNLKPFVQNAIGSSTPWEKESPAIVHNLSHITKGSSLLERAYRIYLRWNIAKNLQNDTFTKSIIHFLDVLKDFEAITVSDGFSASDLERLEHLFADSVREQVLNDYQFFISLAMYEDYHDQLDFILNTSLDDVWIFPTPKEQIELMKELEKVVFCPISEFNILVSSSIQRNHPIIPCPAPLNKCHVDLICGDIVMNVSTSSLLDFKPAEWLNLLAYAYSHNTVYTTQIQTVGIFFSRFDAFLFISLSELEGHFDTNLFLNQVLSFAKQKK